MKVNTTATPHVHPTAPIPGADGHEHLWPFEVTYPIALLHPTEQPASWHRTEADAHAAATRWTRRHARLEVAA